jgi:Domain of unknown function (DUF4382)
MKKFRILHFLAVPALVLSYLCLDACSKDSSNENGGPGSQQLSVYLTDNPALFEKVLVDIRSLEVFVDTGSEDHSHHRGGDDDQDDDNGGLGGDDDHDDDDDNGGRGGDDDSSGIWVNVPISAGVYDLLSLRNGVDTLLGSASLPAGELEKIRIGLGTNHSIIVNGVSFPLQSGDTDKIVINIDDDTLLRDNGRIRLHVDFDAGRSIIIRGNAFVLNPVMKTFCDDRTARIEGRVAPADAFPVIVQVYNSQDTAMAIPDTRDGKFKIRGLQDGIYSIAFRGSNGYRDTILTNVSLSRARDLKLPVIQLLK